jgi:membrane fusion protein (multidrug efflux system)
MSHTVLERAAVPVRATHDLRRQARRLAPAGLAFLLALGAAAYGHHWWTVGRFIESTDDAYVGGEVTVIAPKVSGLIAQVLVTDNQTVRAGDLLVKIDDRDYRAALDKATGAVEAERAALANLDATRRLQEAMIAQAEAEVAAAEAEVARAGFDVVRYRHLAADQFASAQRFQQADADAKKAAAAAEKAKAAVAAARRRLDVIDTQKQQTQAALTQAAADRDMARLNLGYTELRTPIDALSATAAPVSAPTPPWERSSCHWCRRTVCGSTRTSRRASSAICGRACQ